MFFWTGSGQPDTPPHARQFTSTTTLLLNDVLHPFHQMIVIALLGYAGFLTVSKFPRGQGHPHWKVPSQTRHISDNKGK